MGASLHAINIGDRKNEIKLSYAYSVRIWSFNNSHKKFIFE